jgi:selenophosphate synthetase-related protein
MTKRFVFTLVLIALITVLLSACSNDVSKIGVNLSERLENCDPSSRQQILNAVPTEGGIDQDEWLTSVSTQFSCIEAQ